MNTNVDANNSSGGSHESLWCGSRRSSGIFWGLILILIGGIWIGKKTGIIPLDMELFWPAIMVVMGIWMLATTILRRKRLS